MLELARGEALGVDVRELLELERALHGHRVADVAAEEQDGGGVGHRAGELLDLVLGGEDLLDLAGDRPEVRQDVLDLAAEQLLVQLGQVQAQQVGGGDLRQERLGGGDGDLGAGVRVEHGVRLARDRGAVGVADGHGAGALLLGVADRHEGVHGLAGLGDGHHEGVRVDDRVAVAELVGELHLHGDPAPVLDGVLGHRARVGGRAARQDDDLVDGLELLGVDPQLVQHQGAGGVRAAQQGVLHGLGLVVDLLLHEGLEAALLRGRGVPVHGEALALGGAAPEVRDLDGVGRDRHDLVLLELDGLAGEVDEAGDVRAEEVLPLAQADDERRVAARGHHAVRVVHVHGQQGEGTLEALGGQLHGAGQVLAGRVPVDVGEEVGGHLGVRLGEELDALGEQLLAQLGVVLDDAVVDERQPALVRHMRVGVAVGGAAVGGPPGVADADEAGGDGVLGELLGEVGELARLLPVVQLTAVHHGHTGGVVSAVFETTQALHQDVESAVLTIRLGLADVSDDSAHAHENTGPDPTSAHGGPGHSVRDENPAGLASCQAQRSRTIAVTSRRACQPTSAPIASTAAHDSAMSPGRRSTTR